jgi:uncharacterized OB-fold protein
MATGSKPLPQPDEMTQFYWEAARRHELHILRCQNCGTYIHYPKPICWNCLSDNLKPERVSGRGTIYTYTIVHQAAVPGFDVPHAVVLVDLEEQPGVRICANLLDCPLDEIRIGMPVEVVFEDLSDEISLPQFRPRRD